MNSVSPQARMQPYSLVSLLHSISAGHMKSAFSAAADVSELAMVIQRTGDRVEAVAAERHPFV